MDNITKHDITMTKDYQHEIAGRLANITRLEQESYLLRHPEIKLMLKRYFDKVGVVHRRPMDIVKNAALYFKSVEPTILKEIEKLPSYTPHIIKLQSTTNELFEYGDISRFLNNNTKTVEQDVEKAASNTDTDISSFISILTSASTTTSPELVPSLEQTISGMLYEDILEIVNKAVFFQVTDEDIKYDIAYVEVINVVEFAMEIPVREIRKDLAEFLKVTYYLFELLLDERDNTDNESLSAVNEVQLQKKLAKKDDRCRIGCRFNRYPKDCFGVYLPRETTFSNKSITSPVAVEEMLEKQQEHQY